MREISTEILIQATPEKVWEAMTENENWGLWNPFVTRVRGRLVRDQTLHNTLEIPGQKPMTFTPRVLIAAPAKELRWRGSLFIPGLFDGEHYFIFEPLGVNGTRFTHGERFSGLLVFMLNFKKTEAAFHALNLGLKKKVEGAGHG
jgi:hypothetical protein